MSLFNFLKFLVLLLFAVPLFAADYLPGKIYIKISPEKILLAEKSILTGNSIVDDLLRQNGAKAKQKAFRLGKKSDTTGLSRVFMVELNKSADIAALAERISLYEGIEYAEPALLRTIGEIASSPKTGSWQIDHLPDDPLYYLQWYLPSIFAPAAWDVDKGDPSIVIAIVDNGVDWDHPDLSGNIWQNPGEVINGADDDSNGFIDDIRGWDFRNNDNDPSTNSDPSSDSNFHGTHVSGIAAAVSDNSVGVSGIAPDCQIMPIKTGTADTIFYGVEGIIYAYENGAKVINCSFGSYGYSALEEDAIDNAYAAGAIVIAAAGNDNIMGLNYPASNENAVSVAALAPSNQKASFSNYNSAVDISAPGVEIFNTWVTSTGSPVYGFTSGTSMASPIVAGVAALMFSTSSELTVQQAVVKMQSTSDDISEVNPGYIGLLGAGKVNAYRAIGESLPGIRFNSYDIDDTQGGDGDHIPEPGDSLDIIVSLGNSFQTAFQATAELNTTNSLVDIIQSYSIFGDIEPGGFADNEDNSFRVYLGAIPSGEMVNFTLDVETQNGYDFLLSFSMMVNPPYANHNIGNVVATVTNFGALGYQSDPYSYGTVAVGEGFRYPSSGANSLYHGSMALAANQNRVCASIYRESAFPQEFEWVDEEPIVMETPGTLADQQSSVTYHDHNIFLPNYIPAVAVEQNTYAFADPPDDDYIILEYKFITIADTTIENCLVGLFMDWDIGASPLVNSVGYSASRGAGYMFASGSNIYGVAPLNRPVHSHRAIDNNIYTYGASTLNDINLFKFLNGELGASTAANGEYSHTISVSDVDITPDSVTTIAFAVVGGDNLDDFLDNCDQAKIKYAFLNSAGYQSVSAQITKMALSAPSPNPFNLDVGFTLSLNQADQVTIAVYDILGRQTALLHEGMLPPGSADFSWSSHNIASGIYFLNARTSRQNIVHKIILLK